MHGRVGLREPTVSFLYYTIRVITQAIRRVRLRRVSNIHIVVSSGDYTRDGRKSFINAFALFVNGRQIIPMLSEYLAI